MPLNGDDFQALMEFLEQHPEWREKLQQLLLQEGPIPDSLVRIGSLLEQLVRTLATLAEQVRMLHEALLRLTQAQIRTEEAVIRLAETESRVVERLKQLEEATVQVLEAQRRSGELLQQLVRRQDPLEGRQERMERALGEVRAEILQIRQDLAGMRELPRRLEDALGVAAGGQMVRELRQWLLEKGYQLRAPIFCLPLDGEAGIAGMAPVITPQGRACWLLASAMAWVRRGDVEAFAGRLRSERARELLKQAGVEGPVLPLVFGIVADPWAAEEARRLEIGLLLSGQGEVIAPAAQEL